MSTRSRLKLAVLISGRGSNMLAIARQCLDGRIPAEVVAVLSDRRTALGVAAARGLGLPAAVIEAQQFEAPTAFEAALGAAIDHSGAELVLLAGFMRILSPAFVERYEARLLNIHPSLLPHYKGLHTHRRVLAAGESEHGASVHFVTAQLDGGPVICQGRLRVLPGESESSLAARVLRQEHRIYPLAVGLIAAGRLELRSGTMLLDGEPLAAPIEPPPELDALGLAADGSDGAGARA